MGYYENMSSQDNEGISIGIGTTGMCNLNCEHCYSKSLRNYSLNFSDIIEFLSHKKIDSINYGTGENILNPDFTKIVKHCHKRGIKQSLTSNGYSIIGLPDATLLQFNDVDISIDFGSEALQNNFRKGPSWELSQKAIAKCQKLNLEFSIVTALMKVNYKEVPLLFGIAKDVGSNLRINIYKRISKEENDNLELSYEEFWEAIRLLFRYGKLISCTEPVVSAMLNIEPPVKQSPCGLQSIRIHPDGKVVPCVYWNKSDLHIRHLKDSLQPAFESHMFKLIRHIPAFCSGNCALVNVCGGGCASRRFLGLGIENPDPYCPIYIGKADPSIDVTHATNAKELVHSSYLCTLIFEPK